jgi:23S rRNA A2030 N6-methylase RlmJ
MAWSEAIKGEWQAEESTFARQWRLSMINLNKLRPVSGETSPELRERIGRYSEDQNVVEIMIKDAHLIEAAIATDRLIASLDRNARGHFRRLAAALNPLRRIVWVDPSIEKERAVDWLEKGAPDQSHRRLLP